MQCQEQRRIAIDLYQRIGAHIAGGQWQESRGEDFAGAGDENDSMSVANLEASVNRTRLHLNRAGSRGAHAVQRNPTVGWCFSCLDGEWSFASEIEDPVHQFFSPFGRNLLQSSSAVSSATRVLT